MGVKISNSGMTRYSACGKSYEFHYIQKYRSLVKSSALCFGSAIDAGCNYMLENFDKRSEPSSLAEAIEIFKSTWTSQSDRDSQTKMTLRYSANIKYFKSDYDLDVLTDEDLIELGLDSPEAIIEYNNGRKIIDDELKANGNDWLAIPIEDRLDYNEVNWFCLLRKGIYMLIAYHNEILPQFKSILTLQRYIELADEEGNLVNGIAEFVAELASDGSICLVDNKSAGRPYEEDSVETSQQLALYYTILNIQATSNGEWKTPIKNAAFAVLLKKMTKDKIKTCQTCGHVATGSHKLCDAKNASGQRCNGEWAVVTTTSGATQFVIGDINEAFGASVLENASTIVACIEKKIFPKNFSKCYDSYGGNCEFLALCTKKDESSVFKLKDVINETKV